MTDPTASTYTFRGDQDRMATDLCKCAQFVGRLVASETAKVKGESKATGKAFEMTYSYAGLPSVLEALRPGLKEAEIALVQFPVLTMKGAGCTTLLAGQGWTLEHSLVFPMPNASPQTIGGLQTYARRYSLLGVFSLAPDEDDGTAEKAEQAHRAQARTRQHEEARPEVKGRPVTPEQIIGKFATYGVTEAALVAELDGTPIGRMEPSQFAHLSGIMKRLVEGEKPFDVLSDAALDAMTPIEPEGEPEIDDDVPEPPAPKPASNLFGKRTLQDEAPF